jgi:hypothetical protein
MVSALKYHDRVCRIAIWGSQKQKDMEKICEVLDLPFPMLESLELYNIGSLETFLQAPSLVTSIQSLRHLLLDRMSLASLLPLLSVTRALISLSLNVDSVFSLTKEASLLTHLQHMPHLRNLQVSTWRRSSVEMAPTMSVLLGEQICLRFYGDDDDLPWLVAGLDTQSLR